MRIWLSLFLVFSTWLIAAPSTIVTENDPSSFVEGVSVITGNLYLNQEDYVVRGAGTIPIRHVYISGEGMPDLYKHLVANFVLWNALPDRNFLIVAEPNGTEIKYRPALGQKQPQIGGKFYKDCRRLRYNTSVDAKDSPGTSNTSSGKISACKLAIVSNQNQ